MAFFVGAEVEIGMRRLADAGVESPLLDAQLLMAHAINGSRLGVIAHPERAMSVSEYEQYVEAINKRADRCPLAYILGHREFYGIDMIVGSGVLIPRQETELLVDECIARLRGKQNCIIADIGVGSGAIAVALAANIGDAKVYGTEISADALKVAQANIEKHGLSDQIVLLTGDFALPIIEADLLCDAIVSNPPYIPSKDIESLEPEVKFYEPLLALDGGEDGLSAYRRLYPECFGILEDGGFLMFEIGIGEADCVREIAENAGYGAIEVLCDLAGIERVVIAYK
ncbi:MAG: peptide chain release factor N(5)-glutamine methyltransferase [Armatimonadetes bacterium]|nr:peptide chain release factor N(5)-glutamine methyltransferase [Armatimonadota bacterium]